MKKCTINIKFCNYSCPHFYHKFEDGDAAYCDKLNRKLTEEEDNYPLADVMCDYVSRKIPSWCPLEDV